MNDDDLMDREGVAYQAGDCVELALQAPLSPYDE